MLMGKLGQDTPVVPAKGAVQTTPNQQKLTSSLLAPKDNPSQMGI